MNEERLEHLLDRYFDDALSPAERTELESLLLAWPQARKLFWKRARFHALLRRRGREAWGRRLAAQPDAGAAPRHAWREWWAAQWETLRPVGWWAAAGLAALVLTFAFFRRESPPSPEADALAANPSSVGDSQGVATILRAVDVAWTGGGERPGNVLGPGWLRFERGLVEVQFHRGARVIIEGPAEFELISDMQARCLAGKVRAEVPPPSIGFEILSPHVRVVDRGTSFGFDVRRDGPAEIHVFSGTVDFAMARTPQTPRALLQGKAVRVDPSGALSEIPVGLRGFTTGETIEQRANSRMAARFSAWQAEANRLRSDPRVLVHYTFEGTSPPNRTLPNAIAMPAAKSHGTIVGCSWTSGRWPGKQALDFKQIGDRVRLALPRQHEQLTCLTWVRLDAIDRLYTALLMSGDAAVGELQWQFGRGGRLIFGKRLQPGWGAGKLVDVNTAQVLAPRHCGSWMQFALVYDGRAGTVSHYLDGRQVTTSRIDTKTPLITDALEIGNWTPSGGEPIEPIRAFNGRMDEFLIFSDALGAAEIRRLWEIGRPL